MLYLLTIDTRIAVIKSLVDVKRDDDAPFKFGKSDIISIKYGLLYHAKPMDIGIVAAVKIKGSLE